MSLDFSVYKVGAGHAIHLFTPAGETIVIDTGSSDEFSPLDQLRRITNTIHHLIISHPHGDHIREIEKIDRFFNVNVLSRPRNLSEQWVRGDNQRRFQTQLDSYFELDRRFSAPVVVTPGAASGVAIETFYDPGAQPSNLNNHSLVVSVRHLGWTLVFPGDNEPSSWKALAMNPAFAQTLSACNVFLASHHGRESGYCGETLPRLLHPGLCVISDGLARDTDASQKYRARATGLKVVDGSGEASIRYCVTTRGDGTLHGRIDAAGLLLKVENG